MGLPERPASGPALIELGDAALEKKIISAELMCALDSSSMFKIAFAVDRNTSQGMPLNEFPKTVQLKWCGKILFSGQILEVGASGLAQVTAVYRDTLFKAHKHYDNSYPKKTTLRDSLEKAIKAIGLAGQFVGDFSEQVPSIEEEGVALFEDLLNAANRYGFYFVTRPNGSVLFLRVGSSSGNYQVDCQKENINLSIQQGSHLSFTKLHLKHVSRQSGETKDRTLGVDAIYAPLSEWMKGSSSTVKSSWNFHEGTMEAKENDPQHFESQDSYLRYALSKQLMEQERVSVAGWGYMGMPGEKMVLKNAPIAHLSEGAFLIKSLYLVVQSSIPRVEMMAIRP